MIFLNANRIMLWGLYLAFISSAIGIPAYIGIFFSKNQKMKKILYRTALAAGITAAFIDITFYMHNYHNEAIMYPKRHTWNTARTLILNVGSLEDGDVIVKSRGKGLINSAGHVYIYYKGKLISFNQQGSYNTEVMSLEELLDNADTRQNDNRHPFTDKFVVLRAKNKVPEIDSQIPFIKESGYLTYNPTPLQKDSRKYSCSTFVYRILEKMDIVPDRKYISTMPYDFLNMKELKEVSLPERYPENGSSSDFIEIFPLIDLFMSYDVPPHFRYDNGIKLSNESREFLQTLLEILPEKRQMFEIYLK